MDRCQMNRPGNRPYTRTCGMPCPASRGVSDQNRVPERMSRKPDCNCRMPGTKSKDAEMYSHLSHLESAMAYVPCQEFTTTFDLAYALRVGTVFPQLCKPFCGKRGVRR